MPYCLSLGDIYRSRSASVYSHVPPPFFTAENLQVIPEEWLTVPIGPTE